MGKFNSEINIIHTQCIKELSKVEPFSKCGLEKHRRKIGRFPPLSPLVAEKHSKRLDL